MKCRLERQIRGGRTPFMTLPPIGFELGYQNATHHDIGL
jgi:hypothetical protein